MEQMYICPACGKETVIETDIIIIHYADEYSNQDENLEPGVRCTSCEWQNTTWNNGLQCATCKINYNGLCGPDKPAHPECPIAAHYHDCFDEHGRKRD